MEHGGFLWVVSIWITLLNLSAFRRLTCVSCLVRCQGEPDFGIWPAPHTYHALLAISSSLSQFPTSVYLSTHFPPLAIKDTIYFILLSNPVLFTAWKSLVSLRWVKNSQITWHPHIFYCFLSGILCFFTWWGRVCVILFLLGTFRLWPSPDWFVSRAHSLGDWPWATGLLSFRFLKGRRCHFQRGPSKVTYAGCKQSLSGNIYTGWY